MAILIVGSSFLRIAQGLVRFAELFELLFGGFIPWILIRVVLDCQFAVGFFDLLAGRSFGDFEDFVVVALGSQF